MATRGHVTAPSPVGIRKISVELIAHNAQRYPTAGDWVWDAYAGELKVFVSMTGDWRESVAVAVHEIVEATLCLQDHVNPHSVDAFDIFYEKHRKDDDDSEPGDDMRAPYYAQHQVATNVEHVFATALGLHWDTYNEDLEILGDETTERGPESVSTHA